MSYTRIWSHEYGKILLKRAKGALPEMESSKSISFEIKKILRKNDKILDVGCGVGHYYISLKKRIKTDFEYVGTDIKREYIKNAKETFKLIPNVYFRTGDIYKIPFKSKSFDIVMCNNFLHNLPTIEKPLQELLRVTKKFLFIRTLVHERSFRIQEVRNAQWDSGSNVSISMEFKSDGNPRDFNFFNVYSEGYLKGLIKKIHSNSKISFKKDLKFNPKFIARSASKEGKMSNATQVIGNKQVNGCILMPWTFVKVIKS